MTQVGVEALDQLGANFGTLTDAKRRLWHRRLDHFEDADLVAVVDRLMRDPRRERLPTIGQILDLLPGTALPDHGVDMGKAFAWDVLEDVQYGTPSVVPVDARAAIIEHAKACGSRARNLARVLEGDAC